MPLLGSAAMLLSFDIDPDQVDEHDRWHTHEHLPERLSIPGFLRGTRWVAVSGEPRYMVLYEVRDLSTLTSEAYLRRLNNPTPWTQRVMPSYRGMRRGLCAVAGSFGFGQGSTAALIRLAPEALANVDLTSRLLDDILPAVPSRAGLGSAHLLQGARAAPMTEEQRIRGADQGVDMAIVVTGYDAAAVADWTDALCGSTLLARPGAEAARHGIYTLSYSLSRAEVDA